eukprot:1594066-Alexandrium_andersonii.AAC.1
MQRMLRGCIPEAPPVTSPARELTRGGKTRNTSDHLRTAKLVRGRGRAHAAIEMALTARAERAVSYTHLTLPTICSV